MAFLAGLARSSTQLICKRSLVSSSSRIALPVVAKAAVVPATLRRNGTQAPDQQGSDTPIWKGITYIMHAAAPRQRDTTPEQAWERRCASKFARLQQAPLPDASTGRTVYVAQHQTFGMALNRLDQILRTNHVRRELMEGRFFIKGHVRRHKLNAIRWRRRFAQTVREKVQIVQGIRRRGM